MYTLMQEGTAINEVDLNALLEELRMIELEQSRFVEH
jgi:hypothetical protein